MNPITVKIETMHFNTEVIKFNERKETDKVFSVKFIFSIFFMLQITFQFLHFMTDTSTGFILTKENMEDLNGSKYMVVCTVTATNFAPTTKSQLYRMNMAPYGGSCSLTKGASPGTNVLFMHLIKWSYIH